LRSGRHLATGLVPRKTTAVDYAPHNEIQLAHFAISRTPTYDVVREDGGGMTIKKRRKLMRPAFLDFGVAMGAALKVVPKVSETLRARAATN
jgi:hypothetical protein